MEDENSLQSISPAVVNVKHVRSLTINLSAPTQSGQQTHKRLKSRREHFVRILDPASKVVSGIAGLAVTAIAVMSLLGYQQFGGLRIDNLLAVVSITFIGGLLSIGGVHVLTLHANLRKQQHLLAALQRRAALQLRFEGSRRLSEGLQHYSFPSRGMVLIYGHEREARLYADEGESSRCVWRYSDIDTPINFAQSATTHDDRLIALGDYSTGVVTLFDLVTREYYSIHALRSRVEYLEFSPNGYRLLITSPAGQRAEYAVVLDLQDRSLTRLPGGPPATWLNDTEVLLVNDEKSLQRYDLDTNVSVELHQSYRSIGHVSAAGILIAFTETNENETEVFLAESSNFVPVSVSRITARLEHVKLLSDVLAIATSWKGEARDTHTFRLLDQDGLVLAELPYDSGPGYYGYSKYSFDEIGEAMWFCTTGRNRIVRLCQPGRQVVKLDLRNYDTAIDTEERLVSVQLRRTKPRVGEVSLLTDKGLLMLFEVEILDDPRTHEVVGHES